MCYNIFRSDYMKSIVMDNKPKLLENKDFQTIVIKVMFPFVESDDVLAKEHLLPNGTKKYFDSINNGIV